VKGVKRLVCFVTDEKIDLKMVGRRVDVVEWGGLTTDLQMLVLE
jgi:hypothetical protein